MALEGITSFIGGIQGDLARNYVFNVQISDSPVNILANHIYLAQSTTLPTDTIEEITANWQGQMYKIGSTHTYDDHTITFMADKVHALRKALVSWSTLIHNPENNVHGDPNDYFGTVRLEHISHEDGTVLMTYRLVKCWPKAVGEVTLAQDDKSFSTFDVTWTYQLHKTE